MYTESSIIVNINKQMLFGPADPTGELASQAGKKITCSFLKSFSYSCVPLNKKCAMSITTVANTKKHKNDERKQFHKQIWQAHHFYDQSVAPDSHHHLIYLVYTTVMTYLPITQAALRAGEWGA